MDGFVRAGKVAYWGLSNFTGWQLTTVVHLARAMGGAHAPPRCHRLAGPGRCSPTPR